MQTAQVTAERVLPAGPGRRAEAERWLGDILKLWKVQSGSTGRWLAAAEDTLGSSGQLVMYAQYDPAMLLFTLEIWRNGRRVYGIDDWLG